MSIYKDLKESIDSNGYLSYKFDISKYCKDEINSSYNLGGADAFYIFSNQYDSEYREDKFIINLLDDYKNNYDINRFCTKFEDFLDNNRDFLLIYNIDYINEYFIKNKKYILPENIYKLSKYIINNTNNIEILKFGIYLLNQFDLGRIDRGIILDLALCDEFTFYCLFYGIIKFDNSNEIIFDLIKKVFRIGRLFLIDQLKVDSNEKREFLVLNCNTDNVNNIGIGRVIGTKVNILDYVNHSLNRELYIGISNIINSIVFSEYDKFDNYEELFTRYINNIYNYSDISISYFVLTNIYQFVENDSIKNKVYNLVSSRKFKNTMIDYINNSSDTNLLFEITYLLCNIESFGLEKYIYKRFITNSYKYTFMLDLLINSNKYREDSLKVLFDNFKFCDGELTNTYNEYSIESLKNRYILNIIENYPFINNDFIIKSLFSKYVDIRNNTLNTLYTWNRESDIELIDTPIYDKLIELKEKETSKDIKRSIIELLDLDEKVKGTDKIVCDNKLDINYKNISDLNDNLVSLNDRRKLICGCIKNDSKYNVYILGENNKVYRVDCDIDENGNIDKISCNDESRDLDKLIVLYYIRDKYFR